MHLDVMHFLYKIVLNPTKRARWELNSDNLKFNLHGRIDFLCLACFFPKPQVFWSAWETNSCIKFNILRILNEQWHQLHARVEDLMRFWKSLVWSVELLNLLSVEGPKKSILSQYDQKLLISNHLVISKLKKSYIYVI